MKKTFNAYLVGMRYIMPPFDLQDALARGDRIRLCSEPTNSHDRNAVMATVHDVKVAYLDRMNAQAISPLLQRGAEYRVVSHTVPGASGKRISISVIIELDETLQCPAPTVRNGHRAGIYQILCEREGAAYVGQSRHLQKRIADHWRDMTLGIHDNPYLQRLWNTHGAAAFTIEVLAFAPEDLSPFRLQKWLCDQEQHHITRVRQTQCCLNRSDGEMVWTPAAMEEYNVIRKAEIAAHNKYVYARRKEIKAEISEIGRTTRDDRALLRNAKVIERDRADRLKKHFGWRGLIFGYATEGCRVDWQHDLRRVRQRIEQLEQKLAPLDHQIAALKEEQCTLKMRRKDLSPYWLSKNGKW